MLYFYLLIGLIILAPVLGYLMTYLSFSTLLRIDKYAFIFYFSISITYYFIFRPGPEMVGLRRALYNLGVGGYFLIFSGIYLFLLIYVHLIYLITFLVLNIPNSTSSNNATKK